MIGVSSVLGAVLIAGTLHAPAALTLSIHDGESETGTVLDSTVLTCRPAGGTHPNAARACAALARTDGRLDRIRGRDGICPMIYKPVTAVAYGNWGPRPVRFTKTFANRCELRNALTPVYDFQPEPTLTRPGPPVMRPGQRVTTDPVAAR